MKFFRLIMIPVVFIITIIFTSVSNAGISIAIPFMIFWVMAMIVCTIFKAKLCSFFIFLYWIFMTFLSGVLVFNQFTILEGRLALMPLFMVSPVFLSETSLTSLIVTFSVCILFAVIATICMFLDKRYYHSESGKKQKCGTIKAKRCNKYGKFSKNKDESLDKVLK